MTAFATNKSKKDGLSTCCKECHRQYSKRHYQANKIYYACKARKNTKESLLKNREKINDYKSSKGCKYCKETDWACLDFHHPNKDKSFAVSNKKSNGWDGLLLEIRKCDVVCSNCHRKLHAGREMVVSG